MRLFQQLFQAEEVKIQQTVISDPCCFL